MAGRVPCELYCLLVAQNDYKSIELRYKNLYTHNYRTYTVSSANIHIYVYNAYIISSLKTYIK